MANYLEGGCLCKKKYVTVCQASQSFNCFVIVMTVVFLPALSHGQGIWSKQMILKLLKANPQFMSKPLLKVDQ